MYKVKRLAFIKKGNRFKKPNLYIDAYFVTMRQISQVFSYNTLNQVLSKNEILFYTMAVPCEGHLFSEFMNNSARLSYRMEQCHIPSATSKVSSNSTLGSTAEVRNLSLFYKYDSSMFPLKSDNENESAKPQHTLNNILCVKDKTVLLQGMGNQIRQV